MRSAFETPMMAIPTMGNKGLPIALDFTNEATIDNDITLEILQTALMDFVQGIFIDNKDNPNPITFTFRTILTQGYTLQIPANAQSWQPVLVPKGKVFFRSETTLGVIVPIHLVSFPVAPIVWPSATIANVTANLVPYTGAWIDRSGICTGADQQIMAANAGRKGLMIFNPLANADPIYVEYGAAATINSMGVLPGGSVNPDFVISNQAVHILGTVGEAFYAKEM